MLGKYADVKVCSRWILFFSIFVTFCFSFCFSYKRCVVCTGIIAVDEKCGYSLFGRRLSKDRVMLDDIVMGLGEGDNLYVSEYSYDIFPDDARKKIICPLPDEIPPDAVFFFEAEDFSSFPLNRLIVYRWNRHYPSDVKYNPYLHGWKRVSSSDFRGNSHEKITKEVYTKC